MSLVSVLPFYIFSTSICFKTTQLYLIILYFVDRASRYKFLVITNLTHFFIYLLISCLYMFRCGPGSVVDIATAYGLDGPGIESWRGEIFRTCPDRPCGPPSLLYNGYRIFPGGKVLPGRDADPSPPSSAEV